MPSRIFHSPSDCLRALLRRALLSGTLGFTLCALAPRGAAQETAPAQVEEIVANLAAGRVIIAVVKDSILIATLENPVEAQTRVPTPVQLSSKRAGIVLGPVEWFSPSSQQELARLDRELPRLRSRLMPQGPHMQQSQAGAEATDIEAIGQGLLERLNEVVKDLHERITLPAGEPFVEVIVADVLPGYGPEVWQLNYALKQSPERGDYWDTHVLRPVYLQFWPPEKGNPHTLLEFHYPPGDGLPGLMDLLRQKDPRLEKIRASDPKMALVADRLLAGEGGKIMAADATQFLRAALEAIAPPKARETMASIGLETGFEWILQPPPEPRRPGPQKERPADAPTLIHPSQ